MQFHYVSIDPNGRRRSGEIDAVGKGEAQRLIAADGHLIVSLKPAQTRTWLQFERATQLKPDLVAQFAQELAGLLRAGAPLRQALSIQSDGRGSLPMLAGDVLRSVETGKSLAATLRTKPGATTVLAEFAAAGEAGAGLADLLDQGGQFLEARHAAAKTIRSALAYPLFIALLGLVAVIALVVFVAPALAPILDDAADAGLLRGLGSIGAWVQDHSSFVLMGLAGLVALVFLFARLPVTSVRLQQLVWRLPLVGPIARDLSAGESTSVLAALIGVGRPLESALDYAVRVSSPVLAPVLKRIAERLRDGTPAGDAFAAEVQLPTEIRRLARLGEQTGTLSETLHQGAILCHKRAMSRIEKLAAVAAPALVIGLGCGIALLMLTVLSSLMSIGGDGL